jgi:hypothetical protein
MHPMTEHWMLVVRRLQHGINAARALMQNFCCRLTPLALGDAAPSLSGLVSSGAMVRRLIQIVQIATNNRLCKALKRQCAGFSQKPIVA